MALSVASTNSAQFGAQVANGNTALNFLKNQAKLRFQAHSRFDVFISRTVDLLLTRFTKLITAFLSRAKSPILKQEKKNKSLLTLVILICSCRFSEPANSFMKRRTLRRRAITCVNNSVAGLRKFCD